MKVFISIWIALGFASAAAAAAPSDQAFVAKVSQGGMFEVQAGRLAAKRGSSQDIRDFGVKEAHDHTGVGDKLTTAAGRAGISFPGDLKRGVLRQALAAEGGLRFGLR